MSDHDHCDSLVSVKFTEYLHDYFGIFSI